MSTAVLADSPREDVELRSELFGSLVVPAERIFHFEAGLVGLPECRRFALLPGRPGVYWLQSLDHTALTFLLADPFLWVEGFELDLDVPPVGGRPPADLVVLSIVTLPRSPGSPATLNLQGPLLLSLAGGGGRQLLLSGTRWGVRHPVDLSAGPVSGD